jgi:hypothetical protein
MDVLCRWLLGLWLLAPGGAKLTFIRVHLGADKRPQTLETAITTYSGGGAQVDLVGVLHMGERDYYQRLNQGFKAYDAVLYELIAETPRDPRRDQLYQIIGQKAPPLKPKPIPGYHDGALSAMQVNLCEKLQLAYQLDFIDYQVDNFVHADLSPRELTASLKGKQNEQELFKKLTHAGGKARGAQVPELSEWEMLRLYLTGPNERDRYKMRQSLAYSFADLDGFNTALNGEEASLLILRRDKRVLQVLQQQLKAGKKKIAIFYGAAHMPDLAHHLSSDFHLHFAHQEWLPAWSLRPN